MHHYQIRTYTLASKEAADAYEEVWRRHLSSLPKFGIAPHAIWRPLERPDQIVALVSFPADGDRDERDRAYMASAEFKEDFEGFTGEILGVDAIVVRPTAASPIR